MHHAFKLPRQDEDGSDLLITDGCTEFWQNSPAANLTTIVFWDENGGDDA